MIEDKYSYNSVDVARYIIAYANEYNFVINMTKLQKLLYICYGVYLAVANKRLTNEHPQAWPFGPVFPTTRNKLLKEDFENITLRNDSTPSSELTSLITLVLKSFGGKTASYLTAWSHQQGSPWDKTVKSDGFSWGRPIPDEYILEYFRTHIVRHDDK